MRAQQVQAFMQANLGTLERVADVPASFGGAGARSKVVGLADLPGRRFAFSLFDAGEIWEIGRAHV